MEEPTMEIHGGQHMARRPLRLKSLHLRLRRAAAIVAALSATTIAIAGLSAVPASAASSAPAASSASAARSAPLPAKTPTVVTFTFDNQWASQMTAATALRA